MKKSLHAFLTGLIDYAGFFPPAQLNLETSLNNFGLYLSQDYGWMLSRCILPCNELENIQKDYDFRYSVIVSSAVTAEEIESLSKFSKNITMIEVSIADSDRNSAQYTEMLAHIISRLELANLSNIRLFIEANQIAPVVDAIVQYNCSQTGSGSISAIGYKLRCGGTTSKAFPAVERVAEVITTCSTRKIPFKFTGGLHQPLRYYHPEMAIMQHGFINVFGASLLYAANRLPEDQIIECLEDEDATNIHFTDEQFSWKSYTLSTSEIDTLRENRIVSFGSCSFEEPLEGLAGLGLL
ncbi:hypothetical protein [Desulfosediminicola flagellatus]|uniref:hypothetical protein n=1 Tax=Desulfosediminicola flagellatus TaxID=2569541 RepID=UPI0010AD1B83|nr:hypothetical protein [Desulfosediminicola flagellatus]